MFKSTRWRSEKNKIKAVFKLQFHATQLAQLGGDALMISVVPADIGKPTSRPEKAKVQDGSCYWEKPLYETVKFSQDPKTGKFYEKIYYFVVAKDSSRFGGFGEVSIDFANYAETSKLSSLSLPLKNTNSAAMLHVLIQRVQGSFEQREIDGSGNESHHDRSLRTYFGNNGVEGNIRSNPTEDHGALSNGINRDHRASNGSDIMLSSSDSSSGIDTPMEHKPKNTKPAREPSITVERSSQWDWLNGSSPKLKRNDSSVSTLGESLEDSSSDAVIQKLKVKVAALTRQADLAELELQALRKQIVKEMKKSQDLSRDVANLEEERNALKEVKVNGMLLIDEGDPWAIIDELRQELNHEKDLSSNLSLQLQKTQESNAELILALEKSKSIFFNGQQSYVVGSKSETDDDEEQRELEAIVREHSGTKETYLLEQKIVDLYGEIELYKRDKDELEMQIEQIALDYEILKQENHEMCYKLERSQLQEQLKIQYECTSYATLNELESQIEILENDLKLKSKELSESILAIKELETHIKNLEEDLENQSHGFEIDLEDLMNAKTEQEQRAIRAEDNLRKMRLQNANAAARLQEELRRLSQKMASTFEVNEKAAMKAMDEANILRVEKRVLEDMIVKMKEELQHLGDRFQEKLVDLSDQISLKSKQLEKIKKQIENMAETERQNRESERLEEVAIDSSDLYLLKEKDLQYEIKEFERKLDVATAENSNPTMKSNNKTEDQEDFDESSKKMTSLENKNRLTEVEPQEMQEKRSEITL
ncbi:EEIG1/EHBP1 N-terminal domain-containing protein [Cynara cardunculus var. scolymus]|uniref:EEIG1/EHBP1 N-terminal domain-containing protein n=1 Tax=Cynara cardunculus var. scolymus TaxID=59895 RepID=A0A103XJQ4_CYNCS|nr:EEIG1/EHBP1 N-terminal domain-containing protein [Cynara cardunculus var. scolymus]